MYRNVQNFSFSNIDKYSTGGIITRLTTDVTNVQMAFMMIIRIAVRCPIMLICAWVMTFRINPQLALVFLIVIPVLAVGLLFIMTRAHPIFEKVFKKYDWMNNVVQENLLGIRGGEVLRSGGARERKIRQGLQGDLSGLLQGGEAAGLQRAPDAAVRGGLHPHGVPGWAPT